MAINDEKTWLPNHAIVVQISLLHNVVNAQL